MRARLGFRSVRSHPDGLMPGKAAPRHIRLAAPIRSHPPCLSARTIPNHVILSATTRCGGRRDGRSAKDLSPTERYPRPYRTDWLWILRPADIIAGAVRPWPASG